MKFFIPFLYTLQTRYISIGKKIVYLITFILPELLIFYLQTYKTISFITYLVISILSITSFVNIYELGYIYNDTETIKKEKDPTKRLKSNDYSFYKNKKLIIYSSRILCSIAINIGLYFYIDFHSLICFSALEIVTMVVYWIYNHVRGNKAMFVYFFLISFRYLALPMCAIDLFSVSIFLASLFVFPLVRTFEYKAHYGKESNVNILFRKYIIRYDINKITSYRVCFTFILLMVSIILYVLKLVNYIPIITSGYIFIYRLILFVITKLGFKSKDYLKRS